MSRMIDLIRASAVPSTLMQSAAKGSLSVPPREMIEILVYLAINNKVFGEQAQLTLAGWDEAASQDAARSSTTPREVLDYLISPDNLRPVLLPALLGNPSVSNESLLALAPKASRDAVELMLKSDRIDRSIEILKALFANHPRPRSVLPKSKLALRIPKRKTLRKIIVRARKTFSNPRRPMKCSKAKRCSTKACWPTFPNMQMKSRPRPTMAISRSAEFTKNSRKLSP
jgi:hypothetical protein